MAQSSVSVLTLNCEGHKHLDVILPFLKQNHFEIVCLQEVYQADLSAFETAIGGQAHFVPLVKVNQKNRWDMDPLGVWGVATFSVLPVQAVSHNYYVGQEGEIPTMVDGDPTSFSRAVLWIEVTKDDQVYTFAQTHFSWSSEGKPTETQRRDFQQMKCILDQVPEFILCGDFNSPRGTEIHQQLSRLYTDDVPATVTTTIDPHLHRQKNLELVVDGIFSTPAYLVSQVEQHCDLSDHCGLSATVKKVEKEKP